MLFVLSFLEESLLLRRKFVRTTDRRVFMSTSLGNVTLTACMGCIPLTLSLILVQSLRCGTLGLSTVFIAICYKVAHSISWRQIKMAGHWLPGQIKEVACNGNSNA